MTRPNLTHCLASLLIGLCIGMLIRLHEPDPVVVPAPAFRLDRSATERPGIWTTPIPDNGQIRI